MAMLCYPGGIECIVIDGVPYEGNLTDCLSRLSLSAVYHVERTVGPAGDIVLEIEEVTG